MRLCDTCTYRNQDEYHKPCIVYRDDCEYYEKERGDMTREQAIKWLKYMLKNFDLPQEQYQTALDMAIKALEQTKWIPVSEWLPKRVEWYLTSIKWDDGTERVITSWFDGVSFKAEVIAWMPLPEPYEPQESEE